MDISKKKLKKYFIFFKQIKTNIIYIIFTLVDTLLLIFMFYEFF